MEWTAWEGSWERDWCGPDEFREVIQIGLLALHDEDEFPEIDATQFLVRPTLNPTLSDYIINLTGITQRDIDIGSMPLHAALSATEDFISDAATVYSFGRDGEILQGNCDRVGVPFQLPPELFQNAVPEIAAFTERPGSELMSSRLPEIIGFPSPGQAHDALSDCRCIAETFRIMRRAGAFPAPAGEVAISAEAPFNHAP